MRFDVEMCTSKKKNDAGRTFRAVWDVLSDVFDPASVDWKQFGRPKRASAAEATGCLAFIRIKVV